MNLPPLIQTPLNLKPLNSLVIEAIIPYPLVVLYVMSCVISAQDILDWKSARSFFYWRLRRLLLEEMAKAEVLQANGDLSDGHIQSMLRRWFVETEGTVKVRTQSSPHSGSDKVHTSAQLLTHVESIVFNTTPHNSVKPLYRHLTITIQDYFVRAIQENPLVRLLCYVCYVA